MSGSRDVGVDATGPGEGSPESVPGGRYVYCLVDVAGREAPTAPSVVGVDGCEPSLVTVDGVGAVVHACQGVYEGGDPEQVERWLLAHQSVVDAAAERFGTPLPFRFDVVFEGGDAAVREWLRSEADRLRDHLDEFAGRREYRVALEWAEGADETLRGESEELRELHERLADAGDGRGYLLERQYEERLRAARAERADELAESLAGAVDPVVIDRRRRERSPALAEGSDDALARFSVLADVDDEGELGEQLDEVAEHSEVVVRFTGPWPPYTFAPDLGGA